MESKKVSIKEVFNKSMAYLGANWKKAFLSSIIQFGVFLVVYLLTSSFIVSLISWTLFMPTQTAFLINMADENVKVENIFKLGSRWVTYLLLAIFCVVCYMLGVVLAIVPAIILFVNYAFVFDFAKDNDIFNSLKQSHQTAKGFRPKLLALSLIYLFILLVLIAFSILIAMLVGLILNTNSYLLYLWGTFVGFCLFLVLVSPVMTLSINHLKKSIIEVKQFNSLNKIENDEETIENEVETIKQNDEVENSSDDTEDIETDPTSYIV